MMKTTKFISGILLLAAVVMMATSCKKPASRTTGWEYNNSQNGGFQVANYIEQETGPGLVFIEGGTFLMGRTNQEVADAWDNVPRRVTVSSFYMDQTEVANIDYTEYLYWISRIYGIDFPRVYEKALPDTLVWRKKLAYNEPLTELYLRHPAYKDYPVVGVNWLQARDYCAWRSDRVNEQILIDAGILKMDPMQQNEENFNTRSYLAGQFIGLVDKELKDLNPNSSGTRGVKMEDGILLPAYRLPTEAEWEFAALGLIGNTYYERVVERRIYPWNGHNTRTDNRKYYGEFVANFVRARGDMMGVAGYLNDKASITAPVFAYWPNDYGLYNMAGNVAEWVADVYRPLSFEDFEEFNPFRGNVFSTMVLNNEGAYDDKLDYITYDYRGVYDFLLKFQEELGISGTASDREVDLVESVIADAEQAFEDNEARNIEDASQRIQDAIDKINNADETIRIGGALLKGIANYVQGMPGQMKTREVRPEENIGRRNYREADNINYRDGDTQSMVSSDFFTITDEDRSMYDYGNSSLINNRTRVYKGGSWRDREYWLSPGTRRFLEEDQATEFIGFRCAMQRVGSPKGN
ncbi:MAG: SUMF1/EgtB/PvdO family nonheme iron enzyme [Bacteroidales bacterium]